MSDEAGDDAADAKKEAALDTLRRLPLVRHQGLTLDGKPSEADLQMAREPERFRVVAATFKRDRWGCWMIFVPAENDAAFEATFGAQETFYPEEHGVFVMGCLGQEPNETMRDAGRWRFGLEELPPVRVWRPH